jgi:aryl-alcohol dehydrogenase-like predicted oxidoreductase
VTSFPERVTLGKSGLQVGPLGVAGGYGIEERPLLDAFERGVNYWYHGSLRGRGMTAAIRTLAAAGRRQQLVVVLQSYSRWGWLLERTFRHGLASLGLAYADVLLLGLFNSTPPAAVLERALELRRLGLVRHLAISAHRRAAFAEFATESHYDIFHVRYSAAHPGADSDVFPRLPRPPWPGIVAYTATRWGQLLDPQRMPPDQPPLRGRDCYRFVLGNPHFDVCMSGPRNGAELEEALATLDEGPLSAAETERIKAIGQFVRAQRSLYQKIRAGRGSILSGKS